MYYVYELVNLLGTVEYVGQTIDPKRRFHEHTKSKPKTNNRHGKFYKRQDISMHIVATYSTETDVRNAEYDLQVFWGLPTDRNNRVKGFEHWNCKLTEDKIREIKSLLIKKISCAEIGRRFNIPKRTVGNIKSGRNWSHIS